MKSIKKFLWLIFLQASPVLAKIDDPVNPDNKLPGGGTEGLKSVITSVSNALLAVLGVVCVLFIIIGGFQYVASAGNPDSVGKAKNTILYAVIGLIFAILSYAIVSFIVNKI